MRRDDFTLAHRLRVRWAEVDMQGVVFNGHYLMYFDVAIAEYWRAIGRAEIVQQLADIYMRLYVVKATIEYHGSAHYDDAVDVCCRVDRLGRTSMTFRFGIWRGADHLISGEIVYVHAAPGEKKSAALPQVLVDAILAYERVPPETGSVGAPR
jgi:acyl-CoA thioester hydrolase